MKQALRTVKENVKQWQTMPFLALVPVSLSLSALGLNSQTQALGLCVGDPGEEVIHTLHSE